MSDHLEQPAAAPDHERHGSPQWKSTSFVTRMVFLIIFVIVIAAVAFLGETLGHTRSSSTDTITVTGSGTVTGTPNTMSFQMGVQTPPRAPTPP